MLCKAGDLDPLGLTNLLWAFTKLESKDATVLGRMLDAGVETTFDFSSQNLANARRRTAKLGAIGEASTQAVQTVCLCKLREFEAFDMSILVWAYDILNLGSLLDLLLPDSMEHFSKDQLCIEEDYGMFWFDFANVVGMRVSPSKRAKFDAKFEDRILNEVKRCLTDLSSTETDHAQALKTWQERVEQWQIPYVGPLYSSIVLATLGIQVVSAV
eukprot:gnl/TRDRNA2_/TRDRNA2_174647_c0_seq5.p1 gnl/TRDRNA2_/TRDRNA2_174647_c0~~gnl/TRDRNA2_/TRDRNA2_174647_c0_seq5.p1  ORF type:complete len:214 (-),score=32.82 gnl/TRDRNA2_/TRDRNA2_174647_c0_seq5:96-737(-)